MKSYLARIALSVAAMTATVNSLPTNAQAATHYTLNQKVIRFNGQEVSSPYGLAARDPNSGQFTTYMPIYYVMQAVQHALNIQNSWDGTSWKLTFPSTLQPTKALVSVQPAKQGYKNIYVNNVLVTTVPALTYPDPYGGQATTYVPIWYVMQILQYANVHSVWNGQLWTMTSASTSSSTPVSSSTPSWMHIDSTAKTVVLDITADQTTNNGGFNFNGYSKGGLTIQVPLNWNVTVHFMNDSPFIPHSAEIVPYSQRTATSGFTSAFAGATTMNASSGITSGQTESFSFTADTAGLYALVCAVPGHASDGLWNGFVVSTSSTAPTVAVN